MVIAADKSGKIKTFVTDIAIVVLLVGADIPLSGYMNLAGLILLGIATVLTIISGIECIVKNKAVLKG
jgi:CDP-diacylglycerol--glycerol-3-phosphate 3-phosphatidyltransferase